MSKEAKESAWAVFQFLGLAFFAYLVYPKNEALSILGMVYACNNYFHYLRKTEP